jgi:hypothetical protein
MTFNVGLAHGWPSAQQHAWPAPQLPNRRNAPEGVGAQCISIARRVPATFTGILVGRRSERIAV